MDDGKLAEFATVTGCADADKARFFLESAAGDVAAAVEAFFEHGDGEVRIEPPVVLANHAHPWDQTHGGKSAVSRVPTA